MSERKKGLAIIMVGVMILAVVWQMQTGMIQLPGFQPKGLELKGDVTATPAVGDEGKYFKITLKVLQGSGTIGCVIIRGPGGDSEIKVSKKVEGGTISFNIKYVLRAGERYKIEVYTTDMKKVGETTVSIPSHEPILELTNVEISYGLIPSLAGTQTMIYAYFTLVATEQEKVCIILYVADELRKSEGMMTYIITTGAGALSKGALNIPKTISDLKKMLRDAGLGAKDITDTWFLSLKKIDYERTVVVFLDTIPKSMKESILPFVLSGGTVIAITPWLGKYYMGRVLWVNPNPHPELDFIPVQFDVFENTVVSKRFVFCFYNGTIQTRSIATSVTDFMGLYIFRVGKG